MRPETEQRIIELLRDIRDELRLQRASYYTYADMRISSPHPFEHKGTDASSCVGNRDLSYPEESV